MPKLVEVDKSIGAEIKNISKPNDWGNINFDIQIHGETVRIVDCPPHRKTDLQKRRYVHLYRLKNQRARIFSNKVPLPEPTGEAPVDKLAGELHQNKLEKFQEDGIELWSK